MTDAEDSTITQEVYDELKGYLTKGVEKTYSTNRIGQNIFNNISAIDLEDGNLLFAFYRTGYNPVDTYFGRLKISINIDPNLRLTRMDHSIRFSGGDDGFNIGTGITEGSTISFMRNGDGTKFLSNDGTYKEAGSGEIKLMLDLFGSMQSIDEATRISIFGSACPTPTEENIIDLLGGISGVRNLVEKVRTGQNKALVPILIGYYHGVVSCDIMVSNISEVKDGDTIILFIVNNTLSYLGQFALDIGNFNTDSQYVNVTTEFKNIIADDLSTNDRSLALSAAMGKELQDTKVGSNDIKNIRKLTQVQYDSLSNKDDKTFYIIVG